jgi:hypothetical protein
LTVEEGQTRRTEVFKAGDCQNGKGEAELEGAGRKHVGVMRKWNLQLEIQMKIITPLLRSRHY